MPQVLYVLHTLQMYRHVPYLRKALASCIRLDLVVQLCHGWPQAILIIVLSRRQNVIRYWTYHLINRYIVFILMGLELIRELLKLPIYTKE